MEGSAFGAFLSHTVNFKKGGLFCSLVKVKVSVSFHGLAFGSSYMPLASQISVEYLVILCLFSVF